jgi:hypothetical protein
LKTLFIRTDVDEIIARIIQLTPDSQRQWGKMNICQMFNHCTFGLETAVGIRYIPRSFWGRLLGGFMKDLATNDIPFRKGSPSPAGSITTATMDFNSEKQNLIEMLNSFYDGGKEGITNGPHAFFGHLTPTQWGALMHKHIDHHLRQFGV